MQITESFENLRADLEPLVSTWQRKLESIWTNIRTVEDKNKRYSYIVEYNRFKDLLNSMSILKHDDLSVYTNEKTIASIRQDVLQCTQEPDNVGTDIGELLTKMEESLHDTPLNAQQLTSDIRQIIKLIKKGQDVIPNPTKTQLIDRLNTCIIARNKHTSHRTHGIVMQLRRQPKNIVHCVAAICHVQCQNCKHFMTFSGNTECDIYAPITCTKCQSFDLQQYVVHHRDEFAKLDELAEIVDDNTKPGTTRAEQFKKWQQAKTKKHICKLQ